ncbi:Glycosyltransferase involved in cell wall bisynthesis [Clostridium sp. DSM 8431]|uniref:glycosyltransferase n=1 Tax=Clostridium sp. DSM 8431 TaxID=1761781 RepID=UPI0008E25B67|nr:glycosyltransferase [Clostridium sp. DSM 8431]SFU28325.1 Glycosyltransferase involved in cell wall bisynthesis [Clostridium sp. DSM 8431]
MHIMVVPSWYANPQNKVHGSFFKEQFLALQKSGEKVTVAYNEIWPITRLGRVREKRGLSFQVEDGLRTYRYKDYNYLPKNHNMFKFFNKRMEKLYLEIVKKEGKVDVIHAHSAFWGGISAAFVAKKYNIPFVLTEHSSLKNSVYVKDSYYKYIKEAYDSADKLITVGNGLKKELENYTDNNIEVIHNLVDFSKFKVKETEKHEGVKLFSLAYLVEGKGMEALIKAFNEAFKDENVTLKIGGDGEKRHELEALIKELNLESKVELLGMLSREEVVSEINNCDGFVLASEHETFGVVYIEAMALGKPVLGTKNGGAEDIIRDYNGILVENKNHKELVKGLKEFVHNINSYDKTLIREMCINNYNEDVIVQKIEDIYNKL